MFSNKDQPTYFRKKTNQRIKHGWSVKKKNKNEVLRNKDPEVQMNKIVNMEVCKINLVSF